MGFTVGNMWKNCEARISLSAPAKAFYLGRSFYDRLLLWWQTLEWHHRYSEAEEWSPTDSGSCAFAELAVHFELTTHTRLPVLDRDAERAGRPGVWRLVDETPSMKAVPQTLMEKAHVMSNALATLAKVGDNFVIPAKRYTHTLRTYGCVQHDTVTGLALRPRLLSNQLVDQLASHFKQLQVRQLKQKLHAPFITSFAGAPSVHVQRTGGQPAPEHSLDTALAFGLRRHSPEEISRLAAEAIKEGREQMSACKLAASAGEVQALKVSTRNGVMNIDFLNPSKMEARVAISKAHRQPLDAAARVQQQQKLVFWKGDWHRSCLSAARGCHVLGVDVPSGVFRCFLCTSMCVGSDRLKQWKFPCLGWDGVQSDQGEHGLSLDVAAPVRGAPKSSQPRLGRLAGVSRTSRRAPGAASSSAAGGRGPPGVASVPSRRSSASSAAAAASAAGLGVSAVPSTSNSQAASSSAAATGLVRTHRASSSTSGQTSVAAPAAS
jgi:hypothetical protein